MSNLNKTAVVTGMGSGIGLALVKKLLSENYTVIGTTRSGELNNFAHHNLKVIAFELTDKNSLQNAIGKVREYTKGIDLLINNAGVAPDLLSVEPDMETFTRTIDTNITGTVFFTEQLIDHINDGGKIIFISSDMGLPGNADVNGPGYRMSKAAINMYAAMLAKRLADRGITVTPIHPGWVQTKLGGDKAPLTPGQSAEGIFNAIDRDIQSGKFYNIMRSATENF
jgi:NAD(P)-dependent dehydrogenase (short-subunit alcohol dehydrogenase family)